MKHAPRPSIGTISSKISNQPESDHPSFRLNHLLHFRGAIMERDQAVQFMHNLLRAMLSKKASDLFITAGFPPAFKVDGKMTPVSNQTLTPQMTADLARAMMNDKQAAEFEATKEG